MTRRYLVSVMTSTWEQHTMRYSQSSLSPPWQNHDVSGILVGDGSSCDIIYEELIMKLGLQRKDLTTCEGTNLQNFNDSTTVLGASYNREDRQYPILGDLLQICIQLYRWATDSGIMRSSTIFSTTQDGVSSCEERSGPYV
jgi:hypothetical protein